MTAQKWHKGPPPSIGWWPASITRNVDFYRWWDGSRWSCVCVEGASAREVLATARTPTSQGWDVEWTDRPATWPARSKT